MALKPTYSPTIRIIKLEDILNNSSNPKYSLFNIKSYDVLYDSDYYIYDKPINYTIHINHLFIVANDIIYYKWFYIGYPPVDIIKNYFNTIIKCRDNFKINKNTIRNIISELKDKKPFYDFIDDMIKINNQKEYNILYNLLTYFIDCLNLLDDYYIENIINIIITMRFIYYSLKCNKKYDGILDYFLYLRKED